MSSINRLIEKMVTDMNRNTLSENATPKCTHNYCTCDEGYCLWCDYQILKRHVKKEQERCLKYMRIIEQIRSYMELDSIIMMSEDERLKGISDILHKYYNDKKGDFTND